MNYETKIVFKMVSFLICLAVVVVVGRAFLETKIDSVQVVCKVDGTVVYEGPSCGINVISSGNTTRVDVKGGFLYLLPKAYYVSHNVELKGVR